MKVRIKTEEQLLATEGVKTTESGGFVKGNVQFNKTMKKFCGKEIVLSPTENPLGGLGMSGGWSIHTWMVVDEDEIQVGDTVEVINPRRNYSYHPSLGSGNYQFNHYSGDGGVKFKVTAISPRPNSKTVKMLLGNIDGKIVSFCSNGVKKVSEVVYTNPLGEEFTTDDIGKVFWCIELDSDACTELSTFPLDQDDIDEGYLEDQPTFRTKESLLKWMLQECKK